MSNGRIINIISNKNYESRKTARLLTGKLADKGLIPSESYNKDAELNICIGGDGAFLRAIHRNAFPQIPFVGINTGHLGFFQEISPKEIDLFIERYLKGDYKTENIFLVDAKVCTKSKCFYLTGVNEIVIKGVKSKIVHLEVFIDNNHLERFSGDGLIVSTPAGSTGYNFSAGGSIVYPSLSSLQITPLAPISSSAYRSLPNSAIVPGGSIIMIKPEYRYENSILVVNDGMEFRYEGIVSIDLTLSPNSIYKLNFSKDMYWNNLKSKFL
ncbi:MULTISPECIES: NAD(+)/NADH kinase [Gudongella]|jgi:NAD+ kinase|uniref:NAD(+)/NADH kinase n=1 Tax=Gudongella oleilytica TaxID=1582259 RepID=UPI002A36DE33|nr:NAD(+)/NADH kinase [Gudongella oleilytica]MDY0257021.1 NAD(+)/NADH kinase [Gudongella oleilytica]